MNALTLWDLILAYDIQDIYSVEREYRVSLDPVLLSANGLSHPYVERCVRLYPYHIPLTMDTLYRIYLNSKDALRQILHVSGERKERRYLQIDGHIENIEDIGFMAFVARYWPLEIIRIINYKDSYQTLLSIPTLKEVHIVGLKKNICLTYCSARSINIDLIDEAAIRFPSRGPSINIKTDKLFTRAYMKDLLQKMPDGSLFKVTNANHIRHYCALSYSCGYYFIKKQNKVTITKEPIDFKEYFTLLFQVIC